MGTSGGHDRRVEVRFTFCFLILTSCFLYSCKFNPNLQGKGTDFLQGKWEEERVPYQDQLLNYTTHNFTFTCDSFYAVLTTHAKVNQYPDTCFNGGEWKEYAKGIYRLSKDTLYVFATFTNSQSRQKLSGCYRIGRYLPIFILKKHTDDTLHLQNIRDHIPMSLALKQKITCNPKPLE